MAKKQCILLTTSRKPTESIRTLCRDLSYTFPNIVRMNRGKLSVEGILERALEVDAEKVILIDRWKEGTGRIEFLEVRQDGFMRVSPIIYVRGTKFRRDFGERGLKGKRIKSVAIAPFSKENFEAKKLENVFSGFLGIPVLSLEEAVNNRCDAVMQILASSLDSIAITFRLIPELVEIGPQIRISHLAWELT